MCNLAQDPHWGGHSKAKALCVCYKSLSLYFIELLPLPSPSHVDLFTFFLWVSHFLLPWPIPKLRYSQDSKTGWFFNAVEWKPCSLVSSWLGWEYQAGISSLDMSDIWVYLCVFWELREYSMITKDYLWLIKPFKSANFLPNSDSKSCKGWWRLVVCVGTWGL